MKRVIRPILAVVVVIAAVAGLVIGYIALRKERDLEATAEAPVVAPSRVERDTDGAAVLKLDAETQKRLGLQTAVPDAGSVAAEITATARVLDGAILAAAWNALRSAQTALEAARADHERKKKLFQNGQNASASSVEQAAALLAQLTLAVEAAHDRIAATWGRSMAQREDLSALGRLLLEREAALVRVDLLASDQPSASPQTVRLFRQSGEAIATATVLGPAPATDSTVAGQSFLGLVTTNAAQLVSGTMVHARLDKGASEKGMVIPHGAVVRHAGLGWAYVQTGTDTFARRVVPLDRPHPEGWLATGEWTLRQRSEVRDQRSDDGQQPLRIVVHGAQSLLSEELKGTIQMKD